MNKNLFYQRFWLLAIWFSAFWVLYGCSSFVANFLIKNVLNMEPLYLMISMSLLFFTSRSEYRKAKKEWVKE